MCDVATKRVCAMLKSLTALAFVAGVAMAGGPAKADCNVRGEYCDYPAWAANAFTAPRDRVPDWVLRDNQRRIDRDRDRDRERYRSARRR
jgi:hypothetical protein